VDWNQQSTENDGTKWMYHILMDCQNM